jgi:hypothetical protein
VFARMTTQVWSLDPDPDNDTLSQVLRIGTNAPWSVLQFGTGDVLFLSDSGVRSLKALNMNLAASVSDVGSPIDLMLIPAMRDNPDGTFTARAVVQPIQGRYWVYLGGTIYVLSYFPAGNITAWSTFKPGFTLRAFAVVNNSVYALGSDNTLYLYGGPSLNEYDSSTVTVRTPHHSIDAPTAHKKIKSLDVSCAPRSRTTPMAWGPSRSPATAPTSPPSSSTKLLVPPPSRRCTSTSRRGSRNERAYLRGHRSRNAGACAGEPARA